MRVSISSQSISVLQKSSPGPRNLVLSPILVQAALALLQHGANGRTYEDIAAVVQTPLGTITQLLASSLKSSSSSPSIDTRQQSSPAVVLEYVSSLFINNDGQLNRTFAAIANEARSSVVPVNFRQPVPTVQIINSWVSQSTRRAIPSILDQSEYLLAELNDGSSC